MEKQTKVFVIVCVMTILALVIGAPVPAPGMTGRSSDDMVYAIDVATRLGCNGRGLMHGGAYPHRGPFGPGYSDGE